MPLVFCTPKPTCILGFLISRSRTITFKSVKAIIPARLMAINVFPSPDTVDVIAITFDPSLFKINSITLNLLHL
jgi:hypothetical protein